MDEELRNEALDHFKKMASLIYREGRSINQYRHPEVYEKITNPFYGLRHSDAVKQNTKGIYRETKDEDDVDSVLVRYRDYCGLTLGDIHLAFDEGSWRGSFGGRRWARITEVAIEILEALDYEDESELQDLVHCVPILQHNNGLLVNKYPEL